MAEALGAPIFECYASEFNVPAGHPLYLGAVNFVEPPDQLRAALEGCDVLLVAGAPLFQLIFPSAEEPVLPPGTKLIQIDVDAWELNKNVPADVALLADPQGRAGRAGRAVRRAAARPPRRSAAEGARGRDRRAHQAQRRRYWEQARSRAGTTCRSARPRLMHEIRHALPDDALVFSEAITNAAAPRGRAPAPTAPGRHDARAAAAASARPARARSARSSRAPTARSSASAPTAPPCTASPRCGRRPTTASP